jgi:hypothetical protein
MVVNAIRNAADLLFAKILKRDINKLKVIVHEEKPFVLYFKSKIVNSRPAQDQKIWKQKKSYYEL